MRGESSGVQLIHDLVRDGRITAAQGAELLSYRYELQWHRRRRAFWRGFLDGLSLGPVWRWLRRRRP